jgi:hypothetical protein
MPGEPQEGPERRAFGRCGHETVRRDRAVSGEVPPRHAARHADLLHPEQKTFSAILGIRGHGEMDSPSEELIVVPLQVPLLRHPLPWCHPRTRCCQQLPTMDAPSEDGHPRQDWRRSATRWARTDEQGLVPKTDQDLAALPPQSVRERVAEALGTVSPRSREDRPASMRSEALPHGSRLRWPSAVEDTVEWQEGRLLKDIQRLPGESRHGREVPGAEVRIHGM